MLVGNASSNSSKAQSSQTLFSQTKSTARLKTQSAMLEAMGEQKVTVLGKTYHLEPPFFVLATQNPIEQEGTYPLPEAQLDRFMFLIEVEYPSAEEEKRIARETTGAAKHALSKLIDGERIIAFQHLVRRVPVPDHLYDYAVEIVRKTRPAEPESPQWIKDTVGWGAGPRAVQYLILGAKARAALRGKSHGFPRRPRSRSPRRPQPPRDHQLRRRVSRNDLEKDYPEADFGNAGCLSSFAMISTFFYMER